MRQRHNNGTPRPQNCDFATGDSDGVRQALAGLMHYHRDHSGGRKVSRWGYNGSEDPSQPAQFIVYVVSDPKLMHEFEAACKAAGAVKESVPLPALPEERPS